MAAVEDTNWPKKAPNPVRRLSSSHQPAVEDAGLWLYYAPECPFCHRILFLLEEMNMAYNPVEIDLNNKPDWYR